METHDEGRLELMAARARRKEIRKELNELQKEYASLGQRVEVMVPKVRIRLG